MNSCPRALIAEDETLLGEHLRAELQALWPELEVLGIAPNGQAALEQGLRLRPEIVFLDIRMPGLTGLEAATALAEDWPEDAGALPLIVFVTAHDEYALKAFEAAAVDYVLKPAQTERLRQTVQRLQAALAQRAASAAPGAAQADDTLAALRTLLSQAQSAPSTPRLRHLQVAVGNQIELVPVDQLLYLEAADKYVRAVTTGREHWVRISLRELLPQLDPERFWQVHRSTVVNIDAVRRAERLENGQALLDLHGRPERITVSRVHAARFKPL
ncbi:DNA-binding LytR/AlgR family response regulator [Inhella inkyongensis]|uniref:DNA-binding LytR/AlgR family response regulator n=1 Tax=Inhella inkyongensis TaxID=392593 RepID=A0A840S737_9BURK|nr:LytTR family DNA-binding domain-containing protein [Inhella inkyongensis]MBB5205422.1 DNA-binding LytR/AlgR family response regulator [Inhella inkyongensis]